MAAARKTTSSNFDNQQALAAKCVVNDALTRVGARWKMQVLYFIDCGAPGFGALKRQLPGVSDHVLGTRLRELVAEGLVDKQVAGRGHSYRVTPRGAALLVIVGALCDWARDEPA